MTTTDETIAVFANPPVVETVLSVQFDPLAGFTSGHFGWFWKNCLDVQWERSEEAPALLDQFETFAEGSGTDPARFVFRQKLPTERLQIIHRDDDRVIQIQNSRFLYNWRKRSGDYVQHQRRVSEFREIFAKFEGFLLDAGLGPPKLNQWEVTYFNHIPAGKLWQSPRDWHHVLPGLLSEWQGFSNVKMERVGGEWHHEIEPHLGRLHVTLKQGRTPPPDSQDVIVLDLTARGRIDDGDLEQGFAIGRKAIVECFLAITPESIRTVDWKQET